MKIILDCLCGAHVVYPPCPENIKGVQCVGCGTMHDLPDLEEMNWEPA